MVKNVKMQNLIKDGRSSWISSYNGKAAFFAGKAKAPGAETLRGVSEDVEPCLQIAAHTSLQKIRTVFTSFPFSV